MVVVTRPRAQGYGVQVGGEFFRVTPGPDLPLTVTTRDSLAERVDQSGNPEENVLDLGYSFSRSNLTGGEGLDQWPRPPGEQQREFDSIRFWDSASLEIKRPDAGDKYALRLSKEIAGVGTGSSNPGPGGMTASAKHLYFAANGTSVFKHNDVRGPAISQESVGSGVLKHIHAGEDDTVVAVDGIGDVWGSPPDSDDFAKIYDESVIGLGAAYAAWWIKGRAIVAVNNDADVGNGSVLEVSPAFSGPASSVNATPVVIVLDSFTGTMTGAIDAGHAIVASFSDGTLRSYVPIAETAGQAAELTVKAQVQVPHGEFPINLGFSTGVMMVLTQALGDFDAEGDLLRAYSAEVLDVRFDYVVGNLQLLRTWENATLPPANTIPRMTVSRDSIYFIVIEAPRHPFESDQTKPNNPTPAIWRYDVVTQGLFREQDYLMSSSSATIVGNAGSPTVDNWAFPTYFQGSLIVGARGDPGYTVDRWVAYVEDVNRALKGYLITPNITFGLNTAINWVEMIFDAEDLSPTATVEVYRSGDSAAILDKDHPSWTLVTILNSSNQSGLDHTIIDATAHTQAIQLRLTSAARVGLKQVPEDTAILNRFAIRGLPQHRDWVAEIPVNISDIVEAPGRMPIHVAGHGDKEYGKLVNLQGKHTVLDLFDPPVQIKGIVDAVMTPVTYMTKSGSQGRVSVMRFRGTRTGITSDTSGTSGLGVGHLGVALLGVDT